MFAISTRPTTPIAVATEIAAPGSSVWTCTLSGGLVAHHEQRVAHGLEGRLERRNAQAVALDDEARAVAVARELLVDGFEPERLALDHDLRQWSAGDGENDAAEDLHEPRSARVDDPRSAEDVEELGCPRHRGLTAGQNHLEELRRRRCVRVGFRLLRHLADHREHRPFDGLADGVVCGVAGRAEARRDVSRRRRIGATEHVGEPANDLGEDHA